MERSVFFSYAHEDRRRAAEVVGYLKAAGWNVWVDDAGIRGSARWAGEIERAIGDAAVFVVLLSQASVRSEWVDRELLAAADLRIPIVAAELDDPPLSSSMQFLLRNRQRVRLPTEDNRLDRMGLNRLDAAVISALEEAYQTNPDAVRLGIGNVLTTIGLTAILTAIAGFVYLFVTFASSSNLPAIGPDGFVFPEPTTVAGLEQAQAFALVFAVFVAGMIIGGIGQALRRSAKLKGVRWEMRRRSSFHSDR